MRQLEPEGLARLMPKGGVVRVCHNDLNPLNILVDPNETFLIDIEYSNYNFVEYDLANFINESHIDYAVEESPFFAEIEPVRPEYVGFVVRKYLEIADLQVDLRNFVENVRKCMALSHLNWACWAILYKKCTVQFDYVRHAEYRI
jgi:thiamine kinase-like enzyme